MMEAKKIKEKIPELHAGLLTRVEAAKSVISGTQHVHSSVLGESEPDAVKVDSFLNDDQGLVPTFSWECDEELRETLIHSSGERRSVVREILTSEGIAEKKSLYEKLNTVLEELISNSIFHAYNSESNTRYHRTDSISLGDKEAVKLECKAVEKGVFIRITDTGGALKFSTLQSVFSRCYLKEDADQIDTKDQGAGLGLYMVFETVTHLKFVIEPNKKTTVTCFIADRKHFDPDRFSIDFFETESESNGG